MASISLSDLVLRPVKLVEAIRAAKKHDVARIFVILAIFGAIIGAIYGALFSADKLYILQDAIVVPIAVILTLLFTAPLFALLVRVIGGSVPYFHGETPFRQSFATLTSAFIYTPIVLLLAAPLFILTTLNDLWLGNFVFHFLLLIAMVITGIMIGKLLNDVYKLDAWRTVLITIIISVYVLIIYLNVAALLPELAPPTYYYYDQPLYGAASAMTFVP